MKFPKKLSRREFLQAAGLAGVGATLAACVMPATPGAAPEGAATPKIILDKGRNQMSTETNKAICRRMLDQLWNKQRVDLVQEFYTEDQVQHIAGAPPSPPGLESYKEALTMALAAFPDIQLTYDDEIAEGDKVVFRWTMTATHQGEFMGIPSTGNQITRTGAAIYRLDNAKIAETWFFADNLEFMHQLGAIPMPEAA